jgi:hypothetical protein
VTAISASQRCAFNLCFVGVKVFWESKWVVLFFFLVEILEAPGRRIDKTDTIYGPLRKALGLRATLS